MKRSILIGGGALGALVTAAVVAAVVTHRSADGPAGGWSDPVALAPAGLTDGVAAATSGDGTTTAVWGERRGSRWMLLSADRPLDGRWSAPVSIARVRPWHVRDVSVAVNSRGDAVVAFSYLNRSKGVQMASYRPSGGRWETPQAIAPVIAGGYAADAAIGTDGQALVAWSAQVGRIGEIAVARHADGHWSDSIDALDGGPISNAPVAAIGRSGEAIIAAIGSRDHSHPRPILRAARSAGSGEPWTPMRLADARVSGMVQPAVALSDAGRATLAWARPAHGATALVASSAMGETWSAPVELDRGPRDGVGNIAVQATPTGSVVAWSRWIVADSRVTTRLVQLDDRGAPGSVRTLDTFSIPPQRGPVHYRWIGPPAAPVVLASADAPRALWSRQVVREPVPEFEIRAAAAGAGGSWMNEGSVGAKAATSWPLSVGSFGGRTIAVWATLTDPNGGPIDVSVVEGR